MRTLHPVLVAFVLAFTAPAPSAAAEGDVTLAFEKASGLTPAQQLERADTNLRRMRDRLRQGFRMLEQARGEKDLIKLSCLNEALGSIKGLVKVAEGAHVALQEAVARKDRQTADHEYTKIAIAEQKVEGLAFEAGCALGAPLTTSGPAQLEVRAEGMAAEGDVPTGGAGADVPAGAGSGAAGAAAAVAGGADTQQTPSDADAGDGEGGAPGTIDDPETGGASGGSEDYVPAPVEDVQRPSGSPAL